MVLGKKETVLYGPGIIEDELCGLKFEISSQSFYQVNPVQTEKLYETAVEFAGLTGKETVLDAYCGIGTISMVAAKKAKEVIGVEVNETACMDAKKNARKNNCRNVRYQIRSSASVVSRYLMFFLRGNILWILSNPGLCPALWNFCLPSRPGSSG